jgi:hypothetical protein
LRSFSVVLPEFGSTTDKTPEGTRSIARPIHVHVQMLRAHVALLTRSRHAVADYATFERNSKRARRADAGYATSESEAKTCACCGVHVASVQQHMLRAHVALLTRSRRADADNTTSERDPKRARRAEADYATSERDAKRARRADADQKNAPTQSF